MKSPTPSPISPVKEFEALCDLIPEDAYWGMPLTPDLVRHIRASIPSPISDQAAGEPLAFESALSELVNKIDTGLDSGDLLIDARRASDALDAILTKGDLVANAYDYFRESPGRYENSIEFRIGWNACLDAIGAARAALSTAPTTGSAPVAVKAFGTGAQVVIEGTFDGEHAVLILPAKQPGEVGASAKREGPITDDSLVDAVVLTFPTAEQVERVANALVAASPATSALTDEQMEAAVEAWFTYNVNGTELGFNNRMRAAVNAALLAASMGGDRND